MLTDKQISTILSEIDKSMVIFTAQILGKEALKRADIKILKKNKIEIDKLLDKFPPYKREYLWGRLSALIGEYNSKKLTYTNFAKWLDNRDYRPLSRYEQRSYKAAQEKTYEYIKNVGDKIKNGVKGTINSRQEFISKDEYEEIIKDVTTEAIYDRQTVTKVISEIGHKTGVWDKDIGRIAETEMNSIYQLGKAHEIEEKKGSKALVYKTTYSGACKNCIRLHLTDGVGSRPIIFKLSDLISNGTNIGRKVKDWLAVVGSVHPWCRCDLQEYYEGMEWNEEEGRFGYPEGKVILNKTITYWVGDQEFKVLV